MKRRVGLRTNSSILAFRLASPVAGVCFCALSTGFTHAQSSSPTAAMEKKDTHIVMHAAGTFDVKNSPLPPEEAAGGAAIGRFALDKEFHGDLEGKSKGQMLAGGDPSTGTAGYVAMEYVTGTLHGRSGSFAMQHIGTMSGGKFDLKVMAVPGSGKGELAGIDGTMKIVIAGGKHSYEFDYTLPGAN